MINYISTFLLPASLCGSITTISLLLCRPLAKKLKGSVIRGAIFICCLMYLIPLSLFTPEVAQSREDYPRQQYKYSRNNLKHHARTINYI